MKAEQKKESDEVTKAAEEDRKYIYQATIVRYVHRVNRSACAFANNTDPIHALRIMKSRKVRLREWVDCKDDADTHFVCSLSLDHEVSALDQ